MLHLPREAIALEEVEVVEEEEMIVIPREDVDQGMPGMARGPMIVALEQEEERKSKRVVEEEAIGDLTSRTPKRQKDTSMKKISIRKRQKKMPPHPLSSKSQ